MAAAAAWEQERATGSRLAAARDEAERRLVARERDEAGRLARDYWGDRRAAARPVKRAAYAGGNSVPSSWRNSLSLNGLATTGSLESLRNCR